MKQWIFAPEPPPAYRSKLKGYSRFIQTILFHCNIKSKKEAESFFDLKYESGMHDPYQLTDMERGVKRIQKGIKNKEKIAIYGDYDADGVTASTIVNQFFTELSYPVFIYIPDRIKEGYGLNKKAIAYLKKKKVDLIITVDTGIRNTEEVEYAGSLGIDVVITDHHVVPDELPKAAAVINPHRDNSYPFKELAGAGVAYKLVTALVKKIGADKFTPGFEKWLLDLVVLGTIADVVPLLGENRTLTKYGLIVTGKTRRMGLRMLMEKAGMNTAPVTSDQIAFQIAPRVNAAGRMDHANSAFILLNSTNQEESLRIASQLEAHNRKRQDVTKKIFAAIEKQDFSKKKVIVAGNKDWSVGLVGLVAGKLCDKYNRPTLVYTEEGDQIRGSARSIPEFNIISALERLDDMLLEYGGHKQAAGFTLKKKHIAKFKAALEKIADEEIEEEHLIPKLRIDYKINFEELGDSLLEELKALMPFGAGNPEPVFLLEEARIASLKMVGNGQKHLKLTVCQEKKQSKYYGCIGFNFGERAEGIKVGDVVDIAFAIYCNTFNGNDYLELKIIDIKKHGA